MQLKNLVQFLDSQLWMKEELVEILPVEKFPQI